MPKQIFQLESGTPGPQCPGAAKKLDGFDGEDAFVAGSIFEELCDLLPGLVFLFWGKIYDQPIGLHHALNNFHKFLPQNPLTQDQSPGSPLKQTGERCGPRDVLQACRQKLVPTRSQKRPAGVHLRLVRRPHNKLNCNGPMVLADLIISPSTAP